MIGGDLIDELNTIHKGVVSKEIYILKEILLARHARCRACRARSLACRAMLVCQAVEHAGNRAMCYRLLCRLYTSCNELGS